VSLNFHLLFDQPFNISRIMEKKAILDALAALSQETRLDVFRLLVLAGPEGVSAGVLGERLGVTPSSLSFHLAQLKHAGLVEPRRDGRQIIYSANFEAMNGLVGYLTDNCCNGRPELCAPDVKQRK